MGITASNGLELVEEKPILPAMSSRASTSNAKVGTGPAREAGAAKTRKAKKAKKAKTKKAKAKKGSKKRA